MARFVLDSRKDYAYCLNFHARRCLEKGWSVIPVLGDAAPQAAKAPPIPWGRYRFQRPTPDDLEAWFFRQRFGGLAVVCGSVSNLIVLDFDDPRLAEAFARQFPDLTATYTVRSGGRGLPHYYWRPPAGRRVMGVSAPGVDLRAEGAYVVAPPTRIAGGVWELVRADEPRQLSDMDLRRVLQFLASLTPAAPEKRASGLSDAIARPSMADRPQPSSGLIAGDQLLAAYRAAAPQGRNQALFAAALRARDSGWTFEAARAVLASAHAVQPAPPGHRPESHEQRYQEALRTLRSAYSRPPRRRRNSDANAEAVEVRGLPTAVREKLLQAGLAAAARVLDGLLLAGVQPGTRLTEREICQALADYAVGRRSVMAALRALLPDQQPVFRRESPASPRRATPQAANAVAYSQEETKKCDLYTAAERVKKGRPPARYLIPSVQSLAESLGARLTTVDPLTPADLAHPAAYRRALHRELVKRRPGRYTRGWLAARVGVSTWTVRRYDQAAGVRKTPSYQEQPLNWRSLDRLLPAQAAPAPPAGVFLEDERGKRYPPLRFIAIELLHQRARVQLKRQTANLYAHESDPLSARLALASVGIPTPQPPSTRAPGRPPAFNRPPQPARTPSEPRVSADGTAGSVGIPTPAPAPLAFWLCPHCLRTHVCPQPPAACDRCGRDDPWQRVPEAIWRDNERLKSWWQALWLEKHPETAPPQPAQRRRRSPRRPPAQFAQPLAAAADEALALRAHHAAGGLSLSNARRLVYTYGARAVGQALAVLAARQRVANPPGFLVTVARCEHKFASEYNSS